jgi:hypothetical protein
MLSLRTSPKKVYFSSFYSDYIICAENTACSHYTICRMEGDHDSATESFQDCQENFIVEGGELVAKTAIIDAEVELVSPINGRLPKE